MGGRTTSRRALGTVVAGGLALVLAACNPLEITPRTTPGGLHSEARFRYTGPSEVWFEVQVRGIEGYQVETRTVVWVPQSPPNTEQRVCGSATERGVRVDCAMFYPEFPHAVPYHRSDRDAPGTFWPTIVIRDGEQVQVHVMCYRGEPGPAAKVDCPASTRVQGRTVDDSGKLVGDLKNDGA